MFAVRGIGVSEDVGDQEREYVSEGAVAEVDAEDVVVVGVEELNEARGTRREEMPPA